MIAAAVLTFAVLLAFFEGLRRAKARGPWLLGLAVALPLFLAGWVLSDTSARCENLSPPFLLMQQDLEAAREEMKWRLRTCGGSEGRWNALLQIEAQIEQEAEAERDELL